MRYRSRQAPVATVGLAASLLLLAVNDADARGKRAQRGDVAGAPLVVRLGARPTARQRRQVRRRHQAANPEFRRTPRRDADDVNDKPGKRTSPAVADAPPRAGARAAAAADFTLFRSTVLDDDGAASNEPTAANDRNGVLATGNWYAGTSFDDGATFSDLNPFDDPLHGGFCCDQVAYPIDRGGSSLIFWLRQYQPDKTGKRENALRISRFDGRGDLEDGVASCAWAFEPSDFELKEGYWFDYNRVSSTNDFLYVTTNVRDADKDDKRVGALIFRFGIDDAAGACDSLRFDFWYEKGDPYITLAQNGGSTMFAATHVHDLIEGDQLRIYTISDASDDLEHEDKNIENFARKGKDLDCPVGQLDPCDGLHSDQVTGFRSGSTVGFMWTAAQDGEFPFPHVRVAVFETGTLDKVLEWQISNSEFAWALPAVGVNSRGELGVVLYAIGGGRFPKAQAFLRENPRVWSGIQMHSLADSNSSIDDWGDYASVRPYGDCTNTFLAAAWTVQSSKTEGRSVWFGKEGDGCPDLTVTALLALPATLNTGSQLSITATTRNIGSSTAAASTTRYYLSRDAEKSSDDALLNADTAVPELVRDGQVTGPVAVATIPEGRLGANYLIACADDRAVVSEITDTNNCFTGAQTIVVEAPLSAQQAPPRPLVNQLQLPKPTKAVATRGQVPIDISVRAPAGTQATGFVSYRLSRTPQLTSAALPAGRFAITAPASPAARDVRARHTIRLPARAKGRSYVIACAGQQAVPERCLPSTRPLFILPAQRRRS